jgi:hypothetical protein
MVVFCLALGLHAHAQSGGNSGSINGIVVDPTGAVVPDANVEIHQAVSGYDRTTITDINGKFDFPNVPFNPYHMTVTATGFAQYAQDVETRSVVPVTMKVGLAVAGSFTMVSVEAGEDLVENDPTFHSDIDKNLFDKLPLESTTSSLSSLVTLSTPGIAAAGGIRRQDERGDCGDYTLRPGRNHASWKRKRFLWFVRDLQYRRRSRLREQNLGKLHRRRRVEHRSIP